jgi:hypothetical protein
LAHPTCADVLQKLIGADEPAFDVIRRSRPKRMLPEVTASFIGLDERFDFLAKGEVIAAGLV